MAAPRGTQAPGLSESERQQAWAEVMARLRKEPYSFQFFQAVRLLEHWREALVHIDYLDPAAPKKLLPRLNQLFNRAQLTQEEVHILRGMAKAMLKR